MNENLIIELEKDKTVTATFRKLEPAKREKIYRTAVEAFSNEVYDRVSLDGIAGSAQFSKGSLIQYFTNKENVLKFVMKIFLDDYKDYWAKYFAGETAVRAKERIITFFLAMVESWEMDKTAFRFHIKMCFENDANLTREYREKMIQIQSEGLNKIIRRGMETGEIRRDIEVQVITELLLGLVRSIELICLPAFQTTRGRAGIKDQIERMTRIFFDGVKG